MNNSDEPFSLELQGSDSEEMNFAFGVVTFVMNQYFPYWFQQDAPGDGISNAIRRRILLICEKNHEKFRWSFQQLFQNSPESFVSHAKRMTNMLRDMKYRHKRFLHYCSEISVYSAYMYHAGNMEGAQTAISNIFSYLWYLKSKKENFDFTLRDQWKNLEEYCKYISDEVDL
ncbi:hypothetical protein CDAR_50761 [Caerostris darwini]|uniref:Uncharacterized protein n=1 Tax=Caerostris darwini TaxID=1538125 RepID=A0AAV4U5T5_9ARAC|nr:hypothetical protein CDAR_50761 [Caerostris darwini]